MVTRDEFMKEINDERAAEHRAVRAHLVTEVAAEIRASVEDDEAEFYGDQINALANKIVAGVLSKYVIKERK